MSSPMLPDVKNVLTGKDGRLFVTPSDGRQIFLAEVDTFQVQMTFNNTQWQPVGSSLQMSVPTGFSIALTFTETVIRDDAMLEPFLADLRAGKFLSYDFQGALERRDGAWERQVFRRCLPSGTIDLMNLTPGDIIKRSWSFAVNDYPDLQEYLPDAG